MSAARRKNHDSSSSSQTSASSQIQNSLMKAEARFPLGRTLVPPQSVYPTLPLKVPMAIFQSNEYQRALLRAAKYRI